MAYAAAGSVAFRGAPNLHTAAHEAAHVVQQRGGVSLKGGLGEQGDAHEEHADAVADLVVQGKSAEGLLDGYSGTSPAGARRSAVQRKNTIAAPSPTGRKHPGATGETRFSTDEKRWINEVLANKVFRLMFTSYGAVPPAVLHRVASVGGAKGQHSKDTHDIAISNKVYDKKEVMKGEDGKRFVESDEEAFNGTLIHELFHYIEHNTQKLFNKMTIPAYLVATLLKPAIEGFPKYAFGWFIHPKSKSILHFDVPQIIAAGGPKEISILSEPTLFAVRESKNYEPSPMHTSDGTVDPEEDIAESMSLYFASKRTRGALKATYKNRHELIRRYFEDYLKKLNRKP